MEEDTITGQGRKAYQKDHSINNGQQVFFPLLYSLRVAERHEMGPHFLNDTSAIKRAFIVKNNKKTNRREGQLMLFQ